MCVNWQQQRPAASAQCTSTKLLRCELCLRSATQALGLIIWHWKKKIAKRVMLSPNAVEEAAKHDVDSPACTLHPKNTLTVYKRSQHSRKVMMNDVSRSQSQSLQTILRRSSCATCSAIWRSSWFESCTVSDSSVRRHTGTAEATHVKPSKFACNGVFPKHHDHEWSNTVSSQGRLQETSLAFTKAEQSARTSYKATPSNRNCHASDSVDLACCRIVLPSSRRFCNCVSYNMDMGRV